MANTNKYYLSEQIITYLGNKRKLLPYIEKEISYIKKDLKKKQLVSVDLFSGSGIVARMLKKHSSKIIVNDLEAYSKVTNKCYLSNASDFDEHIFRRYQTMIENRLKHDLVEGLITKHYAPKDDQNIQKGERVFYTRKNAHTIDTIRQAIDDIPENYKAFFLGPLLYQASVHNNTGGVFKGFYKDSQTGIGQFGGNGKHALKRIKGDIKCIKPVFSPYDSKVEIHQKDANDLVNQLDPVDLIYIDPPYNQHPYGSNYFMLNVIVDNQLQGKISPVSGIPQDWNRSDYNKKQKAMAAFQQLIHDAKAEYLLVSYNSEGFIDYDEIVGVLKTYGHLRVEKVKYNTYRASRNLRNRNKYVHEYIFILKKK
jgi:adenine-specific DNA-methyltransferase